MSLNKTIRILEIVKLAIAAVLGFLTNNFIG